MFENAQLFLELQKKLIYAIETNKTELVQELFEGKGENDIVPDINGSMQDTPLILAAAQMNHWDMLKELFFYGANLDVCNVAYKWYLIHEVTVQADDAIFNAVAKETDLSVTTRNGETPFMIALTKGKYDRAKTLLDIGNINIDGITLKKENAGHYALREKQYDLFIELVEKGLPINQKSKEGKLPLDLVEDPVIREDLEAKIKDIQEKIGVKYASGSDYKYVAPEVVKTEVEEKVVTENKPKKNIGLSSITKR